MSSKENYCYRILKMYSLIVDFDGIPSRDRVPSPVDGETFSQWKKRVLGESVTNVVLYAPTIPTPQKRISTLQSQAGAENLEKIFMAFNKEKNNQKKVAISNAIECTEKKYSSFSKETLEDIVAEFGDELEPSVVEFFARFKDSADLNIDSEKLITDLIIAYNGAVRKYRMRGQ